MSSLPVPGTVKLVDLQGTSNLHHGKNQKDIILVPQPTEDPNDPLSWSSRRRLISTLIQMAWTLLGSAHINGLTPAYLLIHEETGITIFQLNTGNGLMYLLFGFANLITQPYALNYGRRPAAVFSMLITSFLVLWSSFMNSAAEWYANRILIGISFSAIECLIELCITDTKFIHERGLHMGLYNWGLWGGAFIAPIPAGFLAEAAGWRWINRMYAVVGFLLTIACFFLFEETMFYRPHVDGIVDAEDDTKKADVRALAEKNTDDEKASQSSGLSVEQVGETYQVKSSVQKLKLWGHRDPRQPNTFMKFFFLPFELLRYPSIVFSGILVGGILSWFNVLLGTISSVFDGDPYNFSANMVGLTYIACLIGCTIGCLISGWLNDSIATFVARKNNGIKEPEARLWVAIVPFILHPAGCVLYGVGAAKGIHWVGVCFGLGVLTCAIVMGSVLALNYCVDCYKEIAGEALITVIIIRNCMGFAFSYAVSPMIDNLGLQGAFLLMAFLGMGIHGLSFVMIAYGKKGREITAPHYWKLVEEHGFRAH
ncbi:MFS general substrate transporter [Eremomyces bilateralis CBS 781.70]|uniref:MFS general substrate transporter n=1 Tax=Eremomyces bilateralis CBS 781.70 TaxID=1392243 RepID=A0A6G1FW93_9PEZI|nr:MFS general substrate transporter [Eremomyces bilateralis CBS 781.70]KAF1810054.1 MFS general substrate transporter [Eremomyces bilateralis CBS 781.70]